MTSPSRVTIYDDCSAYTVLASASGYFDCRIVRAAIYLSSRRLERERSMHEMPVLPAIDPETALAARVFLTRLEGRYSVRKAILFGSRARTTHSADSDADIAIVLSGAPGSRSAAALDMAGLAFDVFLETGVLVEALPLWAEEFEHPDLFGNPALIQTIHRDGLPL